MHIWHIVCVIYNVTNPFKMKSCFIAKIADCTAEKGKWIIT